MKGKGGNEVEGAAGEEGRAARSVRACRDRRVSADVGG
jgi:hypothetical protein